MKHQLKAALLSALVLPGMGQLYRGRALKGGIILLLMTLLLLAALVLAALMAQDVMPLVQRHGSRDSVAIAGQLRRWVPFALFLGGALFVVWLYAVVDALLDRDAPVGDEHNRQSP
jgi:hypothetical protein